MDEKPTISEWLIENFYVIHFYMRRGEADPEVAAQLAQEAIARFLAMEKRGVDVERIEPYAFAVAQRVLFDHYRVKGRYRFSEIEDNIPDPRESAEYVHGLRDLLRPEIKKLPRRQRQIIWLRYYDGMSPKEIADELGIGARTVHNMHSLALRRLREALIQQGIEYRRA
ncbi:RNA polymerase sigma factor [Streptomyces prunicolor]|uniref:Sigma-70 family RNA polymerase sigma factor n=1 Tax=Streptomyces prunicolor TaxID=67348 RepID=A0ABU4F5C0_9ACTN|nr:sigma-70 family RNA polymerase sigma factor [Streptomyces prunicolor]MDV7215776.1 sigma-70 family RNA polymerase sigma factor [Streptomyces prunicolor]